jgi:hypothetical protein
VIGTLEQFPTRDLAQVAVNGLRMSINQERNRQREQSIVVADLVDHCIETELSDEAAWHSPATRIVYRQFLTRWIRPHWGLCKHSGRPHYCSGAMAQAIVSDQWTTPGGRHQGENTQSHERLV